MRDTKTKGIFNKIDIQYPCTEEKFKEIEDIIPGLRDLADELRGEGEPDLPAL